MYMLCRFNVTILVLCLCNCSQYYFGYYMFTVALHPPSSLSSQISLETLYEMEGWGVNKKTFKGKCMFPHAVSVCSSFPIPYLPPLPVVPLRSGDWKAVWFRRWLVKLHLQKAHIAILLMLYWGLFRGGSCY